MEEEKENEKKLRNLAISYYSRQDIQKAILEFSRNRETIARSFDIFSKRPDSLEYPSDIINQVKRGFTSFHCSEELWQNPLELSTELSQEKLNELRLGWDLLIDIDSKYLDYSKIACQLIIEALKYHGIKNFGVKFSGGKGFHIIVPWKSFPKEINNQETKNLFPDIPRVISLYLTEIIKEKLISRITELTNKTSYVKDFEASKKVMPDIVLVSPRHLFRAPYSLHEKGLSSIVLEEKEIADFEPKLADPLRVKVKNFYPEAVEGEARELLISALDWSKSKQEKKKETREFKEIKLDRGKINHPPCVELILKGLQDGKKRALFILINYFRSLGFEFEEVEKKLEEWNKLNKPALKQGYINSQISWYQRQKKMLPPNCDKDYYKGIGVCQPDPFCPKIKNPVNYAIRRSWRT